MFKRGIESGPVDPREIRFRYLPEEVAEKKEKGMTDEEIRKEEDKITNTMADSRYAKEKGADRLAA